MLKVANLAAFSLVAGLAMAAVLPSVGQAQSDPITERLMRELTPRRGPVNVPRGFSSAHARDADNAPSGLPAREPNAAERQGPSAGAPASPPNAPRTQSSSRPVEVAGRLPVRPAEPELARSSLTILFETGSATLAPGGQQELVRLGPVLNSPVHAGSRFRIEGHTDRVGSGASNMALSERRAAAVRDYLVQQFGVAADRLTIQGLGETRPHVATPDETPNEQNRRVQVVNLGVVQP